MTEPTTITITLPASRFLRFLDDEVDHRDDELRDELFAQMGRDLTAGQIADFLAGGHRADVILADSSELLDADQLALELLGWHGDGWHVWPADKVDEVRALLTDRAHAEIARATTEQQDADRLRLTRLVNWYGPRWVADQLDQLDQDDSRP